MTDMQWRIWWLAAAGKFFEGLIVFMTGIALPLIAKEFNITPVQHGVVGAASLFGILVGAIALGGLSDHFGRQFMFIVEMIILVVFLALLVASPGYIWLVVFLFGLGVALGCDYPTANLIISESISSSARARLVLAAFGFQAVGAMTGTAVGWLVLKNIPEVFAWRWMYATAIIPAVIVAIGRFTVTESAHWLLAQGRRDDARTQLSRLLARRPAYPKRVEFAPTQDAAVSRQNILALFDRANLRATILAAVPWFLQDLGTYGIGIFTPTILAASIGYKTKHAGSVADMISNDELAAKGAALIDVLLIVGIACAVLLVNKFGSIRLQVLGFIGCAAGLLTAAGSGFAMGSSKTLLIFLGLHAVQLHDQPGPECADLPVGRRSVPDTSSRHGRRLRRGFCQNRCCHHRVPVSNPACRHRHPGLAVHIDRNVAARRRDHLAVPDRDHRHQPGDHRNHGPCKSRASLILEKMPVGIRATRTIPLTAR